MSRGRGHRARCRCWGWWSEPPQRGRPARGEESHSFAGERRAALSREGLDEIAADLHIAKTTTKKQLYAAIKRVRVYLKEKGGWPAILMVIILKYL